MVTTSSNSSVCCVVPNDCSGSWIVDTGTSDHMTFDSTLFTNITYLANPVHIILPDASLKTVTQIGEIALLPNLSLNNVLYVPKFKYNLLSVSKLLDDLPLYTNFYSYTCIFQDLIIDLVVAMAKKAGGLHKLDSVASSNIGSKASLSFGNGPSAKNSSRLLPSPSSSYVSLNTAVCNNLSFDVLQAYLGHTSITSMQHIHFCKGKIANDFLCEIYVTAKSHMLPFNKSFISTKFPF